MEKRKIVSALLAFVMLMSGCTSASAIDAFAVTGADTVSETTVTETATETTEATETTVAAEPFVFNPHIHCDLLSELVSDDMWKSLYNMVDAMRAGEDSFECSDEHAYEWCTDEVTIGNFLPAACTIVVGDGYSNGIGRLKYNMDKEDFLKREQDFETEIERMLNESVRSYYSDFEKLICLYDYVCKNFVYDYSDIDGLGVEEFGNYSCLMKKNGICCEIAYAFAYLLLQCGVEATPYGSSCYHDWTFVRIDGKGYHVDATWALHGDYPDDPLSLQYFMMTEEERMEDPNITKESLEPDLIWPWLNYYDITRFEATDTTFKPLHNWCRFKGLNTTKNVIFFETSDGHVVEMSYGDM